MKNPKTLLVLGFLAGFGVGVLVWQQFVTARLATENQQLREEVKKVAALTNENARLASGRADPAELERLRDGHTEFLRLRGQVAQLRREVQEAKAAAVAAARKVPQSVPEKSEPGELPVETFTANVTASVGWKQTLVTGGWRTPSGKCAFVLLQPTATTDANGVNVRSQMVEIPVNLLPELGLDGLEGDAPKMNGSKILSAEQAAGLLKALKNAEGVDLLNAPEIITLSGRQAQVQLVDLHTLPSGQTYTTGPLIDVVPTISADQQTVQLVVGAQLNLPRTPSKP